MHPEGSLSITDHDVRGLLGIIPVSPLQEVSRGAQLSARPNGYNVPMFVDDLGTYMRACTADCFCTRYETVVGRGLEGYRTVTGEPMYWRSRTFETDLVSAAHIVSGDKHVMVTELRTHSICIGEVSQIQGVYESTHELYRNRRTRSNACSARKLVRCPLSAQLRRART